MPNDDLKIIDTSQGLTKEELAELKRLAAMSKSAKVIVGVIFSLMMFVGFDQLVEWFKHR
jgi:hypothetical protein